MISIIKVRRVLRSLGEFKIDGISNVSYVGTYKNWNEDEPIGEPFNCNITGIAEYDGSENLELYPNPTNELVFCNKLFQSKTEFKIFNTNGQLMKHGCLFGADKIDISQL